MRPLLCLAVLAGCGTDTVGTERPNPECTAGADMTPHNLFPLKVGATWSYAITDAQTGPAGTKTQTITGTTTLPNISGDVFVAETQKPTAGQRTVSYQQDIGPAVIRYSEDVFFNTTKIYSEIYNPYKLRAPKAPVEVGTGCTFVYHERDLDGAGATLSEIDKSESFVVEAIESVTVPAGPFNNAIKIHRTSQTTQSDKLFWYVEDVGKIKEVGSGQTEELSSYSIP